MDEILFSLPWPIRFQIRVKHSDGYNKNSGAIKQKIFDISCENFVELCTFRISLAELSP